MLKKTITFYDLDGNPVTEDFYFNLSKAEIAELELSHEGGFVAHLHRIIGAQDGAQIVSTFKSIIAMAVGRRSEDGRRFVKSQEITDDFLQTEAYSQLFMELVTDATAAAQFIKGIVPADLRENVETGKPITDIPLPDNIEPKDEEEPAWITENREPTLAELRNMTKEQMLEVFRRRQQTAE